MQIAQNTVVSMRYTLTNTDGEVLDQADTTHPFMYLHGANNIIPGLESALDGKRAGDVLKTTIKAEDAYGLRNDAMIQQLPREAFNGIDEAHLVVGAQLQAQTNQGVRVVSITAIDDNTITIDGNHPLAGLTLTFDVEVLDVRAAGKEEISHGHVHAPGMHEH